MFTFTFGEKIQNAIGFFSLSNISSQDFNLADKRKSVLRFTQSIRFRLWIFSLSKYCILNKDLNREYIGLLLSVDFLAYVASINFYPLHWKCKVFEVYKKTHVNRF